MCNLMDAEGEDWMSPEDDELMAHALDKLEEEGNENFPKNERDVQLNSSKEETPYKQAILRAVHSENNAVGSSCDATESVGRIKEATRSVMKLDDDKKCWTLVDKDTTPTSTPLATESVVDTIKNGRGNRLTEMSNGPAESNKEEADGVSIDDGSDRENVTIAETPLQIYRGKYLKVTDLTAQAWCEQQMVYSFAVPRELLQTPAMEKGTDMHLVKELEVHDIEEVSVTTKEDSWAVKFINIFTSLTQLLAGSPKVREMPIFGEPFGMGVFFSGIIDEIRWNKLEQLELVEFKTRVKSKTLPSSAQRRTHKLQVSLYKHFFDTAVRGMFRKEALVKHLGLNLEKTLSDSVLSHTRKIGMEADNLTGLVEKTLEKFQFMQQISCLTTEYTSQSDSTPFATESYEYDEEWLWRQVDNSLQYWKGGREPVGVDIEDAWKCHRCMFEENCEWKKKMIEECIRKNSTKRAKLN